MTAAAQAQPQKNDEAREPSASQSLTLRPGVCYCTPSALDMYPMHTSFSLLFAILCATSAGSLGCASSTAAAAADGASSPDAAVVPGADAAVAPDAAPAQSLAAPTIERLMRMDGGLHVMWTNNQKDCDAVVGERKSGTDEWAVAFTAAGTADNLHQTGMKPGVLCTYRLRCKKGADFSAFSNEKSQTP